MTLETVAKVQSQVARVADKATQATTTYKEVIGEHKKGLSELAEQIAELQRELVKSREDNKQLIQLHEEEIKVLKDAHKIELLSFAKEIVEIKALVKLVISYQKNAPIVHSIQSDYCTLECDEANCTGSNYTRGYPEGNMHPSAHIPLMIAKLDEEYRTLDLRKLNLPNLAKVKVLNVFDRLTLLEKLINKV